MIISSESNNIQTYRLRLPQKDMKLVALPAAFVRDFEILFVIHVQQL